MPLPVKVIKQHFNKQINHKDMKNYGSHVDALDDFRKRGYEADFATETDCLY
jgi:hypothetical protein